MKNSVKKQAELKLVGKIKEAHGLRGEFYVLIFSGDISWLPQLEDFYLENSQTQEGQWLKKTKAKAFKNGFILSVEGITDRTQAEKFHGFNFSIPAEHFVSKPGETIYLSEIEGFQIKEPSGKLLGQIIGFSSNGLQDLLLVEGDGKKAMIPFVKEFIKEINFKEKFLVMDLPEGLFDLENL